MGVTNSEMLSLFNQAPKETLTEKNNLSAIVFLLVMSCGLGAIAMANRVQNLDSRDHFASGPSMSLKPAEIISKNAVGKKRKSSRASSMSKAKEIGKITVPQLQKPVEDVADRESIRRRLISL